MTTENSLRGKKARADGVKFELKVRKHLEADGWIVDKWSNNVEFNNPQDSLVASNTDTMGPAKVRLGDQGSNPGPGGKLIIAKRSYNPFNKVMAIGVGFPDFICFKKDITNLETIWKTYAFRKDYVSYEVIGVEAKSAKYLDKEEKAKVKWLLENKIFSKILVAYKGENGEILYTDECSKKGDEDVNKDERGLKEDDR